jgi:hypothetical protein
MKTNKQKKQEVSIKLYRKIIKTIGVDKAVRIFGEKDVKWAIGKYLTSIRERTALLKARAETEQRLREIEEKL